MGNIKGQWGNVRLDLQWSILPKTHALLLFWHWRKEIVFFFSETCGFILLWLTFKMHIRLLGSFILGCGVSAHPTSNPKPNRVNFNETPSTSCFAISTEISMTFQIQNIFKRVSNGKILCKKQFEKKVHPKMTILLNVLMVSQSCIDFFL